MPTRCEPEIAELKIIRASQLVYGRLLAFYPAELRHRFGAEMADVFQQSLREAAIQHGIHGIAMQWSSALWELFTVAAPSRLESSAVMAGALSFLVSSVLFLAFFSALKKVF
jgi:hypothetical protein